MGLFRFFQNSQNKCSDAKQVCRCWDAVWIRFKSLWSGITNTLLRIRYLKLFSFAKVAVSQHSSPSVSAARHPDSPAHFLFCSIFMLRFCSMSLFSILLSHPFPGFQKTHLKLSSSFPLLPILLVSTSLNITYIFTLTCIVYRMILYSPVNACLYLHPRQIIVTAHRDYLLFSLSIFKLNILFLLSRSEHFLFHCIK